MSLQTKGIIRDSSDTLLVMNNLTGEQRTCYYDSYTDTYCIPGVSQSWQSRSDISLNNWRFIDGNVILYHGDEQEEIPFDSDPVD